MNHHISQSQRFVVLVVTHRPLIISNKQGTLFEPHRSLKETGHLTHRGPDAYKLNCSAF